MTTGVLGELAISFCGIHRTGLVTGLLCIGPGGVVRCSKNRSCLIWTSLDAGSQPPWLSVTKTPSSGPKPMPLGVRRPPATTFISPVWSSTVMLVPRSVVPLPVGSYCGLVVAPP